MSLENVIVNRVTKGQKRTTTKLPYFGGYFGDFKTNPNGPEFYKTQFKYFYKKLLS